MAEAIIDFTPSIILSAIAILGASGFIVFLTRGKTRNEIKKRMFAISVQCLIITSHISAIAGLALCMKYQDLSFENVNAWSLLDVTSIIDSIIGLLLMLVDLKVLALIVRALDDPPTERTVRMLTKLGPPVYIVFTLPFIIYEISWSIVGTPLPFLAAISEYMSIFGVFWLTVYESGQSFFIFYLIFTGRLLSGKSTEAKRKKIKLVAIFIFASLSADITAQGVYIIGRFTDNLESSTVLYHLVWFCSGLHTIWVQLIYMSFLDIFQQDRLDQKSIGGITNQLDSVSK